EQKFRTLKAFWQLLADRLLDYPGTCESNQRAGFGDIEVAEHRKAGGHAASSRVGEHTDVRYARVVELPQRGRNFRHLHQAYHAFHHSRAARGGHHDKRLAFNAGAVHGPGNGFAYHRAHGPPDETVFHGAEHHFLRADSAGSVQDCIAQARGFLRGAQPLFVWLYVREIQWVGGAEARIDELVSGLEKHLDALPRAQLEMVLALGAYAQVRFEIRLPDGLPASLAFHPQAFGAHRLLRGICPIGKSRPQFSFGVFAFEPRHTEPIVNAERAAGGLTAVPVQFVALVQLNSPLKVE